MYESSVDGISARCTISSQSSGNIIKQSHIMNLFLTITTLAASFFRPLSRQCSLLRPTALLNSAQEVRRRVSPLQPLLGDSTNSVSFSYSGLTDRKSLACSTKEVQSVKMAPPFYFNHPEHSKDRCFSDYQRAEESSDDGL
jgi:hypothetical protein